MLQCEQGQERVPGYTRKIIISLKMGIWLYSKLLLCSYGKVIVPYTVHQSGRVCIYFLDEMASEGRQLQPFHHYTKPDIDIKKEEKC